MSISSHGSLKLSVGASTGMKIGATLLAIPFVGIPLFAISKLERAVELSAGGSSLDSQILMVPFVVVLVVFLVVLLGIFRFRAEMEGSVVEVHGAFTTRRVDLARARVWLDSFPECSRARDLTGRRLPYLYLYAQERGGRKVLLRLRAARAFLPPHELAVLASAIESDHRIGQDAEQASRTAGLLRRLSADPAIRIP
ncbi:hypothetical protein OG339_38070 [Streptosporangium sp. NBC_01495]|uniref:hypothetical protein n=1 Tax=Streptosporangium sp. NBC_01495 TaxID=2903899 RepID=UPI002E2F11D3|nr:hypothetical protein [Streptosporangium sp. NBC_01495]